MKLLRKMKWAIPVAMLAALISYGSSLAVVELIIDHFDSVQTLTLTWLGTPISGNNAVSDATVLGGERDIVGTIMLGQAGQQLQIQSNNSSNSLLEITSGNSVASWSELQYDGSADSPKSDIDFTGLAPTDLTTDGDRFVITIVFDDRPADLIVTAYTDAANSSSTTINLPGNVDVTNPLILDIPFSSFSPAPGSPGAVDFADLGALTIRVDATNFETSAGLDLTIHMIGVAFAPYFDFGDLPDTYQTTLPTGARNIVTLESVLLGPGVTLEGDGQPDPGAALDANDDGVVRTPGVNWSTGPGGGSVDITVSRCETDPCYVSAWIDWDQDGNFGSTLPWDADEHVLSDHPVSNGANNGILINVPVNVNNQSFGVRFRIYEYQLSPFDGPHNAMVSGETEDFFWPFGPTAIELTSVEARQDTALPLGLLAGASLLLISAGALLAYKRRRA